jgi:hypothetical protein
VLKRDGRFFHDGALVEHPGMRKAFASWLKRHPDDGRNILDNGYDWSYLTVEGARFFVQSAREGEHGGLVAQLLDGRELPFTAAGLRCDPEGLLSLVLPGGELAAFTPAAQLELSPWLSEGSGRVGLLVAGQFEPIPGGET